MAQNEIWTLVLSAIAALAVIGVPFTIRSHRLQKRAEARDLEARDIVWSASRYEDESGWFIEHSGSVAALQVKIDLTIDGRTQTFRFDRVEPNSPVEVEHVWHKELVEEAAAEERRYEREVDNSSGYVDMPTGIPGGSIQMPAFLSAPIPIPPIAYRAEAAFVATWRSPLGRPDRQEKNWIETY